ncbi:MAG: 50S ribosomal protein L19e [Candidatus Aenigmarchaeota archaeon]|nr:50S ribosomal protein L19e [Candidatus Aenigmarchaeota archaeon]
MNLTTQKRLAAAIMKCGVSRVRITQEKEAAEAITREDVRELIKKGIIGKTPEKGTSRGHARMLLRQKRRGRRRGPGSKKGKQRIETWIPRVRAQRAILATSDQKTALYRRVKGGIFRSKKHLLTHMKEEKK